MGSRTEKGIFCIDNKRDIKHMNIRATINKLQKALIQHGKGQGKMKEIKELYGAHVKFPKADEEIVFNYSAMEVLKQYPLMIEMRYPYFTGRNNSTRYFEEGMLDREYKITDEMTVFYSADKEKCVDWLTEKRNTYIAAYRSGLQRLEQSNIRETVEKI